MKTIRKSIIILAIFVSLTMLACSNPNNAEDPEVSNPTLADLVGTWRLTSTDSYEGGTDTIDVTLTVAADGSFYTKEVQTSTPTSGAATVNYDYAKGSLSTLGDKLRMVTTHTASKSNNDPVIDDDWTAGGSTREATAILVDGKLFTLVFAAQGTVSGIVGTWEAVGYDTTVDPPYTKTEYQLGPDSTATTSMYYSSDGVTYPSEPDFSVGGTYVLNGNGSLSFKTDGSTETGTNFYRIVDSYLLIGDEASIDGNAFIKQ